MTDLFHGRASHDNRKETGGTEIKRKRWTKVLDEWKNKRGKPLEVMIIFSHVGDIEARIQKMGQI